VLIGFVAEAKALFDIPARAFTPPPKVVSTVIDIRPRPRPLHDVALSDLERITAAAFGQRRKMLRQSLKRLGVPPGALLAEAGIAETARAEELDLAQFAALAAALAAADGGTATGPRAAP
jgi:16S rRNA (adenine1518-N6/adenine1519-N6)-dimethyltransferase